MNLLSNSASIVNASKDFNLNHSNSAKSQTINRTLFKLMKNISDNISNWKPFDLNERMDYEKKNKKKTPPSALVIKESLTSLDLYAYLKSRFGDPNGMQMILRKDSSDNLVHWHYTIKTTEKTYLDIWQTNLTTEIYAHGLTSVVEEDWKMLIDVIKKDFKPHGPEMSTVRRQLEEWQLFINPYKRLEDVLIRCGNVLRTLSIHKDDLPDTPTEPKELETLQETIEEKRLLYDEIHGHCVTIKMLTPVMVEAFINLVIFLFAVPDIKKDDRLYQDLIRRDIDIRVRSLHINCQGFSKAVDSNSEIFKKFHRMMNNRNDFLHGNIDPTKLKYDKVYFDYRTVPIFEKRASFGELAFSNKLIHITPDTAFDDLDAAFRFIKYVIECISPDKRNLLLALMQSTSPGWNSKDGRVGVLFPESIIHSVLGDAKENFSHTTVL